MEAAAAGGLAGEDTFSRQAASVTYWRSPAWKEAPLNPFSGHPGHVWAEGGGAPIIKTAHGWFPPRGSTQKLLTHYLLKEFSCDLGLLPLLLYVPSLSFSEMRDSEIPPLSLGWAPRPLQILGLPVEGLSHVAETSGAIWYGG